MIKLDTIYNEDICVFYRKLPTYNPQMEDLNGRDPNHSQGFGAAVPICGDINPDRLGKFEGVSFSLDGVDGLRAAGGADHLAYVKGELFMEEARQLVK